MFCLVDWMTRPNPAKKFENEIVMIILGVFVLYYYKTLMPASFLKFTFGRWNSISSIKNDELERLYALP